MNAAIEEATRQEDLPIPVPDEAKAPEALPIPEKKAAPEALPIPEKKAAPEAPEAAIRPNTPQYAGKPAAKQGSEPKIQTPVSQEAPPESLVKRVGNAVKDWFQPAKEISAGKNMTTSDWFETYNSAYNQLLEEGNIDAAEDLQRYKMKIQHQGFMENLRYAKSYIDDGRGDVARRFVERAYSYMPDGQNLKLEVTPDGRRILAQGVSEVTGENQGNMFYLDGDTIIRAMQNFQDPTNFYMYNKEQEQGADKVYYERFEKLNERVSTAGAKVSEFLQSQTKVLERVISSMPAGAANDPLAAIAMASSQVREQYLAPLSPAQKSHFRDLLLEYDYARDARAQHEHERAEYVQRRNQGNTVYPGEQPAASEGIPERAPQAPQASRRESVQPQRVDTQPQRPAPVPQAENIPVPETIQQGPAPTQYEAEGFVSSASGTFFTPEGVEQIGEEQLLDALERDPRDFEIANAPEGILIIDKGMWPQFDIDAYEAASPAQRAEIRRRLAATNSR